MEIIFLRPEWLLTFFALPLLIITHFFVFKHLKKRAFLFANFDAIKRVTGEGFITSKGNTFVAKNLFLLFLRILTFAVLILAAAGLAVTYKTEVIRGSFIIALDASSSMLADDFQPNRITAAKDTLTLLLTSLEEDIEAGLISFAGVTFIEQPLTKDKKLLMEKLDEVGVKRIGGTDLTQAIITSVNMLEGAKGEKTVILITDGRGTVGSPVEQAIEYAVSKDVIINTIGMATPQGGSFLNIESLSTLDRDTLVHIANATGGRYYDGEDPPKLAEKLVANLEKQEGKEVKDLSWEMLLAGLGLVLVEWLLANTKYRSIP
ncbi:hypothetical protein DRJ48_04885 [Candidatus Woesearchaeota archaeon]|nr:VWA domain-containing protein [Candidatus Woesearchaeota archaeon]RLE41789.1 MAG: hypothetical protein DRJ48_04885 [Candidatus Woesearchaeota archaeon]